MEYVYIGFVKFVFFNYIIMGEFNCYLLVIWKFWIGFNKFLVCGVFLLWFKGVVIKKLRGI